MCNECHTIVTLGARVPEIFHMRFRPAVDSEPFSRTREKKSSGTQGTKLFKVENLLVKS